VDSVVSEFSGYQIVTVNCSAQLSAHQVLYSLQQNCLVVSGIKGKEYKPKQSRLVLFLKNIDLCPIDSYGSSEVVELLLQIINRNGFYSDGLEWVSVSGLQICGTLSDLNKQNLSPRFLSKSNILLTSYPNENDMQKIIINFLNKIYNTKLKISVKKDKMAEIIIGAYQEIREKFTPDSSNHYRFTPKMIEKWIMGLSYYPDEYFSYVWFSNSLKKLH
jgi:dynein heavy chain 2